MKGLKKVVHSAVFVDFRYPLRMHESSDAFTENRQRCHKSGLLTAFNHEDHG